MRERKPALALVNNEKRPPQAGPTKASWEQLEARLGSPRARKEVEAAERRAQRFQANIVKSHSNRGTK